MTPSVLRPAGPLAGVSAEVAWVLMIGGSVVFVGVMALLALALRQRAMPVNERRWLVLGGLVMPTVVLLALGLYGALRMQALDGPADPGLIVRVVGKMWWWEVVYRDPLSGREITLANEIRVPVGRDITIGLQSDDVIHSFWVPQVAGKVDMLPGRTQSLRLRVDAPGVYRGQCAEFCGEQHARMALHLVALTPQDFDAWLAAQARPAMVSNAADAQRGRVVFERERCIACHTVRGLWDGARLGPDLTHVATRLHLGAGVLPTSPAAMSRWIAHVQAVKPGARMPSYDRLGPDDLGAIVAFLASLE